MINFDKNKFAEVSLTLRDNEVTAYEGMIELTKLKFWIKNPRVYSKVHENGNDVSQEDIRYILQKDEAVKELSREIQANGGLIEPLIVNPETGEVLEGNRRLAASQILYQNDPIKWAEVKVRILQKDTNESLINSLLSTYHLKPKKNWEPYEKAFFLYRRKIEDGLDTIKLSNETGIVKKEVDKLIEVYSFMKQYEEKDSQKWSFYDAYLRVNEVNKKGGLREAYGEKLDDKIVDVIKKYPGKALDFRSDLTDLTKNMREVRKFVEGHRIFEESVESARDGGAGNTTVDKFKNFKKFLSDKDLEKKIKQLDRPKIDELSITIGQIMKRLDNNIENKNLSKFVEKIKNSFKN